MKKVGIITFHFVNNFGGVLQAYALKKFISEQCDVEAEIIDYRNWFIRLCDRIRLLPITTNIYEIVSGFRTMLERIERRHKFGLFTKYNSNITKKYNSFWQLKNNPPHDDKYICGSDQIWNPFITMGLSKSYFLRFVDNPSNKIAYAPSFGSSDIPSKYKKTVSKYLEDINYLSAREKTGADLIYQLTGKRVDILIDPTFLLDRSDWNEMGRNPLNSTEPYILLYIMQRDEKVYDYARKLKDNLGIKVVEISRYGYQPGFVDATLVSVGPEEFLGLFRDASYVCTNSYHGLIYSLIFEKELCLIPSKRFSARISNLLALLNINAETENEKLGNIKIDYDIDYLHSVITHEREKAKKYLRESMWR